MSYFPLVLNSLKYYWRTHLGVLLGVIVSTAVLTGALTVGDSVRCSLKEISLSKLGKTQYVMVSGERFFSPGLSEKMADSDVKTAPVLFVKGIVTSDGGRKRVNQAQILGVGMDFREFAPHGSSEYALGIGALVNRELADKLDLRWRPLSVFAGLKTPDEFLVRISKAGAVPLDIPFISGKANTVVLRRDAGHVLNSSQFGDFSLGINQGTPYNVFLGLDKLSSAIGRKGRANLMLIASKDGAPISLKKLQDDLRKHWQLSDAGLHLRAIPGSDTIELTSDRVFIDDNVSKAALQCGKDSQGVFTYFVNSVNVGKRSTPYSFISAAGKPIVSEDMKNDEIIINQWLADDLKAKPGDTVELKYYVIGPLRHLVEKQSTFKIRKIIPLSDDKASRRLMPVFPGLSDTDDCRDWDSSLPIDLSRIRDKDEEYWKKYKGTPKAFVTLGAAQKMWVNRFGDLTAVRYKGNADAIPELEKELRQKLDPLALGFDFIPIREKALAAANNSVDFGQLFIGLSFFLIVAALLLTAMLFVFSVESRVHETGILLSIGYPASTVKRLMLAEGLVLAIPGALVGTGLGILYNRLILTALGNVWRGAVGVSSLKPFIVSQTLCIGFAAGIIVAVIAMWISLRSQTRRNIAELHASDFAVDFTGRYRKYLNLAVFVVAGVAALAILVMVPMNGGKSVAGAFFGSGALLLISVLSGANILLRKLETGASSSTLTFGSLTLRNCVRRRGRSLTVIALMACGVFLVIGVASNKHSPFVQGNPRSSGTGGFALYGESTSPIVEDLNSARGRKTLGLGSTKGSDLRFVQLKLKPGDDASCLNLNQVQNPGILGVGPGQLAKRKAFTFASVMDGIDKENPWISSLDHRFPEDPEMIPAVADQGVIMWGLGKAVGDTLTYTDEGGKRFKVKLVAGIANSIFQGRIVISRSNFLKKFSGIAGTNVLLVDCPEKDVGEVEKELSFALMDKGVELSKTWKRLAKFNMVENTYLTIFMVLGALGVILGTLGLGIVVMRNVLERRQELAIIRAVGYSHRQLRRMLLYEHCVLLVAGVFCGTLAGFVSVLPAIFSSGGQVPFAWLSIMLLIILLTGLAGVLAAIATVKRGEIISTLQIE